MYRKRSSIIDWLSESSAGSGRVLNRTRKRRVESGKRDDYNNHIDRDTRDGKLPSLPTTLRVAGFSGSSLIHGVHCATPVRRRKRRKGDNHSEGRGGSDNDSGTDVEDDPAPGRRRDISGRSIDTGLVYQSDTTQTSEGTGSLASSVNYRRKVQDLALVSVSAPQLAYFDGPGNKPPPLLHDFATNLADIDDNKRFLWPELQVRPAYPLHAAFLPAYGYHFILLTKFLL